MPRGRMERWAGVEWRDTGSGISDSGHYMLRTYATGHLLRAFGIWILSSCVAPLSIDEDGTSGGYGRREAGPVLVLNADVIRACSDT